MITGEPELSVSTEKGKGPMQSQVIVPLDGSTEAEAILPHALSLALQTQSDMILLRVIQPPGEPAYQVPYIPDDWYAGEVEWTKNYLTGLATRLVAQGTRVSIQHVDGTFAGTAIASAASQNAGVRLIAMATHGRDAAGRLLLGSVAGDVYAKAPNSMLVLHPPKGMQLAQGALRRLPTRPSSCRSKACWGATGLSNRSHFWRRLTML
jgi:nucleotide-binding universal stress UspA family protein